MGTKVAGSSKILVPVYIITILCVKLIRYAEEIIGEYQRGFQRGRSTVDQISTMRQILEKCWERNLEVHHLFIDFKPAYDTVWRKEIWSEMHKLGFPKKKSG